MSVVLTSGLNAREAHHIKDHLHSTSKVAPSGAAGVTVTANGSSWTLGSAATIINGTETDEFDIHGVYIEAISADDTFELVLYDDGAEIGRVRVIKAVGLDPAGRELPFQSLIMDGGSVLTAKVMSATGGGTVTVSVRYHCY